jgi:hypothetical protein
MCSMRQVFVNERETCDLIIRRVLLKSRSYQPSRQVSFHGQMTLPPFLPDIGPGRMLRPAFSSGLHRADTARSCRSQADIEERVGQEE